MFKRNELAEMTFEDIRKLFGGQAAIEARSATDPDTFELDDEWCERARPAKEPDPNRLKDVPLDSGVEDPFVLQTFPTSIWGSCVWRLGLLVLNSRWGLERSF